MVGSGGGVLAKGYHVVPQAFWPQDKDAPTTQREGIAITTHEGAATAVYRYLHLKEHRGVFKATEADAAAGEQVQEFPKGRTLFVGNVDDQGGRLCRKIIADRLKRALGACGDVVHVQVSATPDGADDRATGVGKRIISCSRFAHVCFASAEGVQAALALQVVPSGARPSVDDLSANQRRKRRRGEGQDASPVAEREEKSLDENGDETLGYASLIQRHRRNFPPRSQLQAEVDSTMEAFENEEAAEASRRKALIEQPMDDDGFVTVTYKNKRKRKGGNNLPVAGDLAGADDGGKKKSKGAGAFPDFYRFQMRESRREQLVSLRTKFEQDRARVAKMKEQRKFRPF